MGKISEYILELTEMFQDFLTYTGGFNQAKEEMKKILSKDEYEFFEAHEDIIITNIEELKNDLEITNIVDLENDLEEEYMKRRSEDYLDDNIKMDESLVDGESPQERFIDLRGPSGNAYAILGMAHGLCKQLEEVNPDEYNWKNIKKEMTSSDYKNLVNTFENYFGDYVTIYNADVLDEENKIVEGYEEYEPYNPENLIGKIVNKINGNHNLILWFDDGSKANIGCAGGAGVVVDGDIENIQNNEIINIKQEDNYIIVLFFDNNEELYIEDPTGGEGLEIDYINDSLKMPSIDTFQK
jgi:hypothetical protein